MMNTLEWVYKMYVITKWQVGCNVELDFGWEIIKWTNGKPYPKANICVPTIKGGWEPSSGHGARQ